MGELALDGRIKGVRGLLPVAAAASRWPVEGLIVPAVNAEEGALADGVPVYPVNTLAEVVEFLVGKLPLAPCRVDVPALFRAAASDDVDFSYNFV